MSIFLNKVLEKPSYGYLRNDRLYVPTTKELFKEFFSRMNIFQTKKNWLPLWGWFASGILSIPFFIFLTQYFSWPHLVIGLIYSMVCLGTHGTIYLHRYSTHQAYQFSNPVWRFLVRNLVIKIIPEEVYVISHHVHHHVSERPGDPYNVHAGFLYCFLADVNHQLVNRDLNEKEYLQLTRLLKHTGVRINSYAQYQKWGSLCNPFYTITHYVLNWIFWYSAFYLIGGHALATALFGIAVIWAFGVRTFNYDGHGRGKDQRKDGVDFNRKDLSINQIWPGYVAGEWHNNHHLYPSSARSGFLPYQLDLAWLFIKLCSLLGGVRSYFDSRAAFYRDHYNPYLKSLELKKASSIHAPAGAVSGVGTFKPIEERIPVMISSQDHLEGPRQKHIDPLRPSPSH